MNAGISILDGVDFAEDGRRGFKGYGRVLSDDTPSASHELSGLVTTYVMTATGVLNAQGVCLTPEIASRQARRAS
jgi:hypothetical protein